MKNHFTRLIKNTAIYGLGSVLTRVISFLLLPLFTAYLTPADYGVLGILGMISFFLLPVFSLGFGTSIGVCYFKAGGRQTKDATIWTAFAILLGSSLLLCLGGFLLSKQISSLVFQDDQYGYLVTLTLLSTTFGVLTTPFVLYHQFEEMAVEFVSLASVSTVVSIGINVALVVPLGRGVAGLVEGTLVGQILNLFLFSFYPFKRTKFNFDRTISKDLFRNGLPMVPSFASLFILQQGNRYLLQWYRGLNSVGIFTVGYNIGTTMNVLVNAFSTVVGSLLFIFFSKKEEARISFGRIMTFYMLGFGAVNLLFYIYARMVVLVMATRPFQESYRIIGFSATSQFLIGIFSLLLPPVYFGNEVIAASGVQMISAAISIGIGVLAIVRAGTVGAGFALMLSVGVMCAIQYLWNVVRKERYIQIRYEGRRIVRMGVLYAGIAFITTMERSISLSMEALFSLGCTILLGILVYASLTSAEREKIGNYSRSLLFHK